MTVEHIRDTVCDYFNLSVDAIYKIKKMEVVQARQVAMYFSKMLTKSSLATIGMHIASDHATALHACKGRRPDGYRQAFQKRSGRNKRKTKM